MFGRRKNAISSESHPPETDDSDDLVTDLERADSMPDLRPGRSTGLRLEGPFDVSELHEPGVGDRIDLAGMWLPTLDGIELRMQVSQESGAIESVAAVANDSAMELRPFAAPRTAGIWDDVRAELAAEITSSGGSTEDVEGPFGPELHARVSVPLPTGGSAVQPLRFIGVDGPRWFLRAVISGASAVEHGDDPAGIDAPLMAVLRGTVVLRGTTPMAPRDAIDLQVPPQARQIAEHGHPGSESHDGVAASGGGGPRPATDDDLQPFERGPEITELR